MSHVLEDVNRRDLNFATSKVKEVLPEYFLAEYPKLITLLEKYYEYLDSDADDAFKNQINDLYSIRDVSQTSLESLDEIISEIGNGLEVASFFQQPRLMAKLLAEFYSSKGTLVSAEGFFRAFYNEEITVEYPKDKIFILNESQVGYESQKFIQDDEIYQIFSILIKVGLSVTDYQSLYTRFVHPAGWHFQGQVQTESKVTVGVVGTGQDPLDSSGPVILVDEANIAAAAGFHELTALLESDGMSIRIADEEDIISRYSDITLESLDTYYDTIARVISPESFTFDDSDATRRPDTAITLETMDNSVFTRYTSDSNI